jgi:HPt (histidine-containing phosphotransfer) domain-containing protein
MAEPLDRAALDELRAMTGDDDALYVELLDSFLADADVYIAELDSASDAQSVRRAAHSLKSNAMNVGATSLAALCRALESESAAGVVTDAASRVGVIRRELATVREAVLREREASARGA